MVGVGIFSLYIWGIHIGLPTYHTAALSGASQLTSAPEREVPGPWATHVQPHCC